MRTIFESLGCSVTWEDSTKTITATRGTTEIKLIVGSKIACKNGSSMILTVEPEIINGSTYVPPRFVAESLGCNVGWDSATSTVLITTKTSAAGELKVHYIDVGQGDSILIQTSLKIC